MANILVTGGPVHAKLDAVKIITNRFRGGRMWSLARRLGKLGHAVTYLTATHTMRPSNAAGQLTVITHDGFIHYMEQIEMLAPHYDMIVMGAAVANLIPEPSWNVNKKFPSHDYHEGDLVNIPFRVAPRVINEVKRVNPRCTLVGFKLLSGVDDDELVRAAYTVVMDAKADIVVANDATDLNRKLLVTKEHSVLESDEDRLPFFLDDLARDEYYHTTIEKDVEIPVGASKAKVVEAMKEAVDTYNRVLETFKADIERHGRPVPDGPLFGCIAVRSALGGFVCSARGKKDLSEYVHVWQVAYLEVFATGKASLNAPLLYNIFKNHPETNIIVHLHSRGTNIPTLAWAPPGTVRDSKRSAYDTFEIEHHGVFLGLKKVP